MTREQARREIDSLDYYLQNHTDDYGEESHTAMMMAIKALEDINEIKSIIECPLDIQEDVFRYKAICNVFERDEKR